MNNNNEPKSRVEAEPEQMARYGITRIPVDQFHYKSYRYSNLSDALVQAKRDAA